MQIQRYVSFLHAEYSKSSVIVLNKVMNMAEDLRSGMDTRLQRLENKSRSKALTPITPSWIWSWPRACLHHTSDYSWYDSKSCLCSNNLSVREKLS